MLYLGIYLHASQTMISYEMTAGCRGGTRGRRRSPAIRRVPSRIRPIALIACISMPVDTMFRHH